MFLDCLMAGAFDEAQSAIAVTHAGGGACAMMTPDEDEDDPAAWARRRYQELYDRVQGAASGTVARQQVY